MGVRINPRQLIHGPLPAGRRFLLPSAQAQTAQPPDIVETQPRVFGKPVRERDGNVTDRKSTRLNSSHLVISYVGFFLKKKTTREGNRRRKQLAGTSASWRGTGVL